MSDIPMVGRATKAFRRLFRPSNPGAAIWHALIRQPRRAARQGEPERVAIVSEINERIKIEKRPDRAMEDL
jgi:hypothetical protein